MTYSTRKRIYPLILIAVTFILFGRAISYPFVWDDERSHLTANENFMQGRLKAIWDNPGGMYIPVAYTGWYLVKLISSGKGEAPLKPSWFHLANLLIHCINVILLFFLLDHLLGNVDAALTGALCFTMHPLQVESVVWISEFRGLLATFFSLASLNLFIRELQRTETIRRFRNSNNYLFATLLFIPALLSKPSVIVLPVMIPVISAFFYPEKLKISLKGIWPWFILMLPILIITPGHLSPDWKAVSVSFLLNPLIACYSLTFYCLKILFPFQLSPCYGITPSELIHSFLPYFYTLIFSGGLVGLLRIYKKQPFIAAGIAVFLIGLLPSSGIIAFEYQRFSVTADRYAYFGMTGAAITVASLWLTGKNKSYIRYILILMGVVFLLLNVKQVPVWKSEFSIWSHAYNLNPNQWAASYNMGVSYDKLQQYNKAIQYYSNAIRFNPSDKNVLVNRANAYGKLKQFNESLKDYHEALRIDDKDGSIYYNRALTYYTMGNFKKSLEDLHAASARHFPVDPDILQLISRKIKVNEERINHP
ncbi:MAG: tetratricopeptide repeat protein [Bacteroidia bacterium]|nr:tetratricopeptide repeat protein [Bacteroidia bacterium]MCZ2276558.1 tetratricopeptide repeat protein [Bacteroidia bacterium]